MRKLLKFMSLLSRIPFSVIGLRRVDSQKIPCALSELRLFAVIRNEELRLPYFFEYYSKLGVDRFFVVDNSSTDDSQRILHEQEKTHVFHTKESYRKSHFGNTWIQILLHTYGRGHWCVVVDADEFFVFPPIEDHSIKELCRFLESEGTSAVGCSLLDMYSSQAVSSSVYRSGQDPLEVCPFFDTGVRHRAFGIYSRLHKVPLFKMQIGTFLSVGQHSILGRRMSSVHGAILHFKFTADLVERSAEEVRRQEMFKGAHAYEAYSRELTRNPDLSLYTSASILYRDSSQLVDLGIISRSPKFELFRKRYVTK